MSRRAHWLDCVLLLSGWFSLTCSAFAVEFVSKAHYYDPVAGLYDNSYVPPALPRPTSSVIAKVQSSSGVVIAPNWILTAKHIAPSFKPVGVWVNGTQYSVADDKLDSPGDLALLQIVQWNGDSDPTDNPPANFTDYVGIDPGVDVFAGAIITQGGFGNKKVRDPYSGEAIGGVVAATRPRWGRNVLNGVGGTIKYDFSTSGPEEIKFEGHGMANDSGGGYFVKDGWDWRLVGIAWNDNDASSVVDAANYNWIASTLGGDLPAPSHTSKPASNVAWIGAPNDSWSTLTNWEDLDTPGANNRVPVATDVVEITTVSGPQVGSGVSAESRSVVVGRATVNSADSAKLTVAAGGALTAMDIFVGDGAGDIGKLDITGGAITVETEYIGHRGQGSVVHTGGTNTAIRLIVGNRSNSLDATYTLTGASSSGSAPVVNATALVIAEADSSSGAFTISGGSYATVNSTTTVVGKNGEGSFIQQKGNHVTKDLLIAQNTGSEGTYSLSSPGTLTTTNSVVGVGGEGEFMHLGGTHTTSKLTIAPGSSYSKLSGTLKADEIDVQGDFLHVGGTLRSLKIIGEVDLGSGSSIVRATGLADYAAATFSNGLSAALQVDEDSLALLSASAATMFGDVDQLGTMSTHVVGSTLAVSNAGFRGTGVLPDPVELYGGAYVVAGRQSGELVFEEDVTAVSGASQLSAEAISGVVFRGSDLLISNNATLALNRSLLLEDSNSTLEVSGTMKLLPKSPTLRGELQLTSRSAIPHTLLDLKSSGTLELVVTGSAPNTYDRITVENVNPLGALTVALDGQLSLDLDGYTPTPRDLLGIINAASTMNINGAFSSVGVDGGDAIVDSAGIAMAVLYNWTGAPNDVVARASLPADFDLNDKVDGDDYDIWSANLGILNATWVDGDANGDGAVNFSDFMIWQANFGQEWPSALAAPEPSCLAMCTGLGVMLMLRRSRHSRRAQVRYQRHRFGLHCRGVLLV